MKSGSIGMRIAGITAAAVVVLVGAGALGFSLGSAGTADERDAKEAQADAFSSAFADARTAAFETARRTGTAKGLARGRARAQRAGEKRGTEAGSAKAEAELERIAQEEVEAAAQAEAEERAENCGAPLFVEGYCPTDEEIEQENLAESLCGPADPALAEEAELHGIQCRPQTGRRP